MKQRIYNYIITSLMLICVIVTTHIVLNSGIRVFHTFLVRNQSLIITRQTVLNLLTRHMLTIILIVFGACCIFMYFISYEVNDYLQCANCTEKLCAHKKQLRKLWSDIAEFTMARKKQLLK